MSASNDIEHPSLSDDFWVVIPTRFGSSRLPGKPLKDIAGKPMIQHVWEKANCSRAAHVVIATDDNRIAETAEAFGARVVLTSNEHPNGTSRLAEVVQKLDLPPETRIVNVQGDEPLLPAELINVVADSLGSNPSASIATLAEPITSVEMLARPSVVKVVLNHANEALYFSRAPIPWQRDQWGEAGPQAVERLPDDGEWHQGWLRHVGLYAYRASFLTQYSTWPSVPLEDREQLEQLRALYFGHCIQVEVSPVEYPAGVDTPEDLERVRKCFEEQ